MTVDSRQEGPEHEGRTRRPNGDPKGTANKSPKRCAKFQKYQQKPVEEMPEGKNEPAMVAAEDETEELGMKDNLQYNQEGEPEREECNGELASNVNRSATERPIWPRGSSVGTQN